ncbi:hypothetical protein MPTK1_5g16710 [Marchantia polymorpha subsp. ruderalis]|uniref:Uncharacterized protein n=2 Tax=Marchantia polymorpha TaxID=3197 RepID=A0AAF6BJ18_MARPO|nr:hypothetical protein MARPO_0117s0035 [Marchantia polymorpha]BBN12002.1 hypothetical protein Mp_5g16710 [Marchantia polymorpha subsp. ruderalis]|eukprot:PTQ30981.1 hypothetical protein MARPO_0117s0035 [Marchantia polymorpha]
MLTMSQCLEGEKVSYVLPDCFHCTQIAGYICLTPAGDDSTCRPSGSLTHGLKVHRFYNEHNLHTGKAIL